MITIDGPPFWKHGWFEFLINELVERGSEMRFKQPDKIQSTVSAVLTGD